MKRLLLILALTLAFTSCSKDDNPAPQLTPPPVVTPATYNLNGLFKMDTSFSIDDDNLLFENNKLFISTEANSIHQTLVVGANLFMDSVPFTYNATSNKINFNFSAKLWEGTYEPTTGKIINGVVKSSNGVTVLGSFTAQKYIPATSGANLFTGHWKGKYGSGATTPNMFFNLIIENGLLVVIAAHEHTLNNNNRSSYGLSLSAPGINDKTISCIYQNIGGQIFSLQATYNPTTKKLEGTWGSAINNSDGGIITLEPQNLD